MKSHSCLNLRILSPTLYYFLQLTEGIFFILTAPSSSLVSQLSDTSAASAAVDALVSSLTQNQITSSLDQIGGSTVLPVSQSSTPDPTPPVLQQRPKPQRSKLPPPSKVLVRQTNRDGKTNRNGPQLGHFLTDFKKYFYMIRKIGIIFTCIRTFFNKFGWEMP